MQVVTARPKALGVALALLLVAGVASPARANLWSGACALQVAVTFDSPVRPPVAGPSYEIEASGAADLDVTTSGLQACAITLGGSTFGATSATGRGAAVAWSCAETVAFGSWEQFFDAEGPAGFTGSHILTGPWGAWTLHVQNPALNVVGVGELTIHPADAGKTIGCGVGSIQSLRMVGVLVFQDP